MNSCAVVRLWPVGTGVKKRILCCGHDGFRTLAQGREVTHA